MNGARNTRRLVLIFIAVALASGLLGVLGTTLVRSPAQLAADTAPPPPTILTAKVTEGPITDTLVLSGAVALGNKIPVTPQPPLGGAAAVVTKTPVPVGGKFQSGSVLIEIADRPVIALSSPIPLIRDLSPGMSGADVERFQAALSSAGLADSDRTGYFGWATAAAVKELYSRDGYEAPLVGGQVFVSRSEVALIPMSSSGQVVAIGAGVGATVTGAAVTVSTLPPGVSATANAADAGRLTAGIAVTVAIDGKSLPGKVTAIGAPVQDPNSGFGAPITVTLDSPLDPKSVGSTAQISVNLSKSHTSGLKVPLSALYSSADGGTSVVVVTNGKLHPVAVTVTETGDGSAQITDSDNVVKAGDAVRIGASG